MLVQVGSRYVNTDHIVSIEDTATSFVATLVTGKSVSFPIGTLDPDDLCGTIVQASTGMVLVEALLPSEDESDRKVFYRTSFVHAFRITEGTTAPIPIGAFGEPKAGFGHEYAVVQPDGSCFGWEEVWDSLDAFKAEQQAKADRQQHSPAKSHLELEGSQAARPAEGTKPEEPKTAPTGTETVEQLRARILAEPIRALKPDAPWRPDRDLAEVIAAVREANPQLHYAGVGHDPKWGWKWKSGDMERHRAAMTDAGHVEEFEHALRFLSYAAGRFPRAKINHQRTSYSWKHAAERVMGGYVSNGMLVAAAYALGLKVAVNPDSPNPCINLDEKAALLDPERGL